MLISLYVVIHLAVIHRLVTHSRHVLEKLHTILADLGGGLAGIRAESSCYSLVAAMWQLQLDEASPSEKVLLQLSSLVGSQAWLSKHIPAACTGAMHFPALLTKVRACLVF